MLWECGCSLKNGRWFFCGLHEQMIKDMLNKDEKLIEE